MAAAVTTVATVPAVAAVHENVHQRAGQQQQEGQRAEEVRTVLAQQEVRGDGTHDEQADRITRTPEGFGFRVARGMVVVHGRFFPVAGGGLNWFHGGHLVELANGGAYRPA